MTPSDPSATLEAIKDRAEAAADFPLAEFARFTAFDTKSVGGWIAASALDVPSLVAALEAALKLADDWKREAARLEPSGADAVQPAMPGNYLVSGRIGALEDCEGALREAITRTLKGGTDE